MSDWSSDVCSSDLFEAQGQIPVGRGGERCVPGHLGRGVGDVHHLRGGGSVLATEDPIAEPADQRRAHHDDQVCAVQCLDRKSVVEGKSVSVRVDLGGRRSTKKKQFSTLSTN